VDRDASPMEDEAGNVPGWFASDALPNGITVVQAVGEDGVIVEVQGTDMGFTAGEFVSEGRPNGRGILACAGGWNHRLDRLA
jgi:hypothetical protein